MSIECNVTKNGRRIDTFPKGVLDIKKTMDHFNRLKNEKKVAQGAIEVVYFKYVTDFKFSYLESKRITESYQDPQATLMIEKTIFVCETDHAYGIGRMLKTFREITDPQHTVVIVRSEAELENSI